MTITLPTLSALRVNPEWAELPLFDRRGWSRVRFGDVVENCNETCDPESAGIDRFIAMEHLEPGSLHVRSWGDVSEGTTFTRRCRPGQVLFGKRRAYQRKIAVAEFEAVVSGDIYVLGPKNDRLIPELLPFLCLSERFFQHAVGTSAGSLSPRTNWSSLVGYEFDLPPLDQQRRIAEILRAVDEVANQTKVAKEEGDKVIESELHAFLYHGPSWPLAECRSILLEGPRNGYSPPASPNTGRVPTLSISAIRRGKVIPQGSIKYANVEDAAVEQFRLKRNDILVVRGNGNKSLCALAGLVNEFPDGCFYPDLLIRLRFRPDQLLPEFAVMQWNEHFTHTRLLKKAKSSNGISKVNGQDIQSHKLVVPPIDEQRKFFERVAEKRRVVESLDASVRSAVVLRSEFLKTFFS